MRTHHSSEASVLVWDVPTRLFHWMLVLLVALAWVTGGTEIFHQSLHLAQLAEVTEIDADFEGDSHAPQLGPEWRETARTRHVSAAGLHYSFVTYKKS